MKKVFMAAALVLVLGTGAVAFAQTSDAQRGIAAPSASPMTISVSARGAMRLEGTLASVSGTMLTVNSWGGAWNVDASNAKLMRRFGSAANVSEFQQGDIMVVLGTAGQSGWAVTARSVRDLSLQERNVHPVGTVSNASGMAFTLTTAAGKSYQVTGEASTTIMMAGKTASWSDVVNGVRVEVWGVLDRLEQTLSATRIRIFAARPHATPSVTP